MSDKIPARTDLGATTHYDSLISYPLAIRYIAEFMLQTGLLGQFSQEHVGLRAMGPDAEGAG